jgi:isoleucyl-tRNA synthetase
MSNFYLDVIKDRLYVERANSETRRAAQTVIYKILDTLTRIISPILAFTSDEIWRYMPHKSNDDTRSPMLNSFPVCEGYEEKYHEIAAKWNKIEQIRNDVKKQLEEARTKKIIGASLDAKVTLFASDNDLLHFVNSILSELPSVFIVSQVEIKTEIGGEKGEFSELGVFVSKADGEKCARCWSFSETVGKTKEHPSLCERCVTCVLR